MGFLTALICAQALFVERFDAPLTDAGWNVSGWDTRGGVYLYGQDLGAGSLTFTKTDAGTGSPPYLDHTFPQPIPDRLYLRYHLLYQRGLGFMGLWPVQLHYVTPVGTVGELMVQSAGDGGEVLKLNAGDGTGFHTGPNVPISPGTWHLLQLEFEGLGTADGGLSGAIDGELIGGFNALSWQTAAGNDILAGFPAVLDSWTGSFSVENLVVLSQRRAVFAKVRTSPNNGLPCQPLFVDFTDLDGGPLPPPDVSVVQLSADPRAFVFGDSFCGSQWVGTNITTSTVNASIGYATNDKHFVTVVSPDLIGEMVVVPARDAGVPDAGSGDAGAPDAGVADAGALDGGPSDAGSPDAGSPDAGPALQRGDDAVGCGCESAPLGVVLVPLVLRRRRAQKKWGQTPFART
jgi:hypothetical protein